MFFVNVISYFNLGLIQLKFIYGGMGVEGLEPSQFNESTDFKSVASTNSAIPPFLIQFFMYYYNIV